MMEYRQVERIIKAGGDPNARNSDGLTALHKACVENTLNCASTLVQHGANVNAQDNDLWTPLHAAANAGNWRVINYLMGQVWRRASGTTFRRVLTRRGWLGGGVQGADVSAVNADGDLPLDLVTDPKVEKVLLRDMENKGIDDAKVLSALTGLAYAGGRVAADATGAWCGGGCVRRWRRCAWRRRRGCWRTCRSWCGSAGT